MKKLKFFCDPVIAIEALIGFPSLWAMGVYLIYFIVDMWYFRKSPILPPASFWPDLGFTIFFLVGIVVTFAASPFVFCPSVARMELDEEGIQLKQPLKKYSKIPYSKLNFFRVGCYNHAGHIRFFLVMSQYVVPQDDLWKINRVQNSDTLAKIKLTKRNYRKLYEILPEDRKNMLEKAILNAEMHMKQKMRKDKLKRRKKKKKKR